MSNLNYLSLSDISNMYFFNLSQLPEGYILSSDYPNMLTPANWRLKNIRGNFAAIKLSNKRSFTVPLSLASNCNYNGIEGNALLSMTLNEVAEAQLRESFNFFDDDFDEEEDDYY